MEQSKPCKTKKTKFRYEDVLAEPRNLAKWMRLRMKALSKTYEDIVQESALIEIKKLNRLEEEKVRNLKTYSSNTSLTNKAITAIRNDYSLLKDKSGLKIVTLYRLNNGSVKPSSNTINKLESVLGNVPKDIKAPSRMKTLFRFLDILESNTASYESRIPQKCFYSERGYQIQTKIYVNCHIKKYFGGISNIKSPFHSLCIHVSLGGVIEERLREEPTSIPDILTGIYEVFRDDEICDEDIKNYLSIISKRLFHMKYDDSIQVAVKLLRLVKFIEVMVMSYGEILTKLKTKFRFSQSEIARLLNTTQNNIWNIINNRTEYLNTNLCKRIYDLYFNKITKVRWSNMEQRQDLVDSRIGKGEAFNKLKSKLSNYGYRECDLNESLQDHTQDFFGYPYLTKAQNQKVKCDFLLTSSKSSNKIACFFKYIPITKKRIMYYLFMAQELEATHIIFLHGNDEFICMQVHSWPAFVTDIPLNLHSIEYRLIEERHIFSSLDKSIIEKTSNLFQNSQDLKKYESNLSALIKKFKLNNCIHSNSFAPFHMRMNFKDTECSQDELDLHTKSVWDKPLPFYEPTLMMEASKGTKRQHSMYCPDTYKESQNEKYLVDKAENLNLAEFI
ncbi:hypothetical protein [Pseudoalteromonas sp. MelDa3]|uniref:hypothetical protein n=1 Tax=Pseudoalteromonas sp. MelDa3 TaxID=888435 RepID=UPI000CB0B257|nr:hypothetical protein [Pseudoalteromonas sp. MelDa3]PLT25971.1 hypothetical protein CXF89_07555 [Pseudoalteromonas sp. MelDa3]